MKGYPDGYPFIEWRAKSICCLYHTDYLVLGAPSYDTSSIYALVKISPPD